MASVGEGEVNYAHRSDDPNCPGYERCPTCDHFCSVIEFEKGSDEIIHCNHCRVSVNKDNL